MSKSIFASWTFWFGFLQIALGVVGWLGGGMDQTAAFALITTGVGSIGLRLKTSGPVNILPR